MNVSGIENVMTGSAEAKSASESDKSMGRDDFLNLLVVQLKNQDPMDPMESAEFSAQLAQFSSLEQLTNLNNGVEKLLYQQSSTTSTQAVNFIGKSVTASGNSIELSGGEPVDCHFELPGNVGEATVYVYDINGNPIRTFAMGSLTAGEHAARWDGLDASGQKAGDGLYTFEVVATGHDGSQVQAETFMSAAITGIAMKDGGTQLLAGQLDIPLDSVIRVAEPEIENP